MIDWFIWLLIPFALIGVITTFTFIMSLFWQKGAAYDKYNSHFPDFKLPSGETIDDSKSMNTWSYAQLKSIINVIWDVHKEMRKPFFMRFVRYPVTEVEQIHMGLYTGLSSCLKSLETLEKAKISGDIE